MAYHTLSRAAFRLSHTRVGLPPQAKARAANSCAASGPTAIPSPWSSGGPPFQYRHMAKRNPRSCDRQFIFFPLAHH
eukprot:7618800-Heterocapsa_arctica.AAC.1